MNEHNLLNPDDQLDEHTPWPALCGAVVAFLRHRFSNYDQIVCEANRKGLRAEILAAARTQYRWLRPERTPLITRAQNSRFNKRPGEKYLDYLSRLSAEFLSERSQLELALRQNPDPQIRAELRIRRTQLDQVVAVIYQDCVHDLGQYDPVKTGLQWMPRYDHVEGQYNWDGLGPYRLEYTGVRCSRCRQAVLQSKTEISVGQGKKMLLLSCHCHSILATKGNDTLRFRLRQEGWDEEVADLHEQGLNHVQ